MNMEKKILAVFLLFPTHPLLPPPIPHQRKEAWLTGYCISFFKVGIQLRSTCRDLEASKLTIGSFLIITYKGELCPRALAFIRALQSTSRRSKRHTSMKQLKKSGVFKLPRAIQKFDTFKPMHEMWKGYMNQLLKITGKNRLVQCLFGADMHGTLILVAECKITTFTGVSGIMIHGTAETFVLVTQDDKLRDVPKKVSFLLFRVDSWKITLQGDQLTPRNLVL